VIERAVILSRGPELVVPPVEMERHSTSEITREDAPVRHRRQPVRSTLNEVDRDQITRALKEANGRVGGPDGAASRLGLKRTTFITRMKKLGIDANVVSEACKASRDTSDIADTPHLSSSSLAANSAE